MIFKQQSFKPKHYKIEMMEYCDEEPIFNIQ